MSVLPTHDELVQLLGQVLTIETADEAALPLTQTRLTDAPAGLPMDSSYDCYLAHFELPANVRLPQDTYRFRVADGRHWLLFVSPTRPLPSGAGMVCAVIHRKKSDDQAATGLATSDA